MPRQEFRHGRFSLVLCITLSVFMLLYFGYDEFSSTYAERTLPLGHAIVEDQDARLPAEARATKGDQYLLGVGKADITG
jgi:hypothetical protein